MINILTDSTSDIPPELLDELHIEVIPMVVQLNGKIYRDGEDIDARMLFEHVHRTGHYPTTSAPSPGDFVKFFDRENQSIYIGVSDALSSTFANAQLAVEQLGNRNIDLIDSKSISAGYGQVAIKAAEWRNSGMGFEALGIKIRQMVEKTRGVLILDTLDFLYKGGRCSAIEHTVSSLLKIRPLLQILPNGTLGILRKIGGSRMKAVRSLWSFFKTQITALDFQQIYLMHIDCDEEVDYLVKNIKALGLPIEVNTGDVGCVLATHSGPKPLGIAYTVK
jgi:DegV family protein with EDD domain